MRKNSMSNLREVRAGSKRDIYYQATVRLTCVLAVPRTITVGLTKVVNQANPLMCSEKRVVICYQLRPDVQKYGHQYRYTTEFDAAEFDMCTHKCHIPACWSLLP